jgi:hypothetical protein
MDPGTATILAAVISPLIGIIGTIIAADKSARIAAIKFARDALFGVSMVVLVLGSFLFVAVIIYVEPSPPADEGSPQVKAPPDLPDPPPPARGKTRRPTRAAWC